MTDWLARIRLLPVTIFVAALMLTVRVGYIWDGMDGLIHPTLSVSQAAAQQQQPAAPQPAPTAEQKPTAGEGTPPAGGQDMAAKPARRGAGLLEDDPTLLTQAEIDLLQQLAERREALDGRERELERRLALLKAAEGRIDGKVAEMKKLQQTIDELVKEFNKQQSAKVLSLVKIYENMKPKDAARIFEDLEMDTLLMVAERMKERKLAPIMGKMNPEKARQVTVELARLRNLPTTAAAGQNGG
ncbi:MAG: hypothetical protein H6907_17905 [Hyphomicrobiales bacterium]|nr:hypothetical protein [Hyphomicrobiales bacterium]MCP5373608.1 hypothetical protein [Hyphomicrobiales bacterium]